MSQSANNLIVSVITPSFNTGRYIEQAIKSVSVQDYENIEHIIADGGSTDNTLEILQKYNGEIIWRSEQDKGQGDAFNKGVSMAQGEIIGWLDADDTYFTRDVVSKVVEIFQNSDADVVYGDCVVIDEHNRILRVHLTPSFSRARLERFDYILMPAVFFRRKVLKHIGMVDTSLKCIVDYDLWLSASRYFRFVHVPKILGAYRQHKSSITVTQRDRMREETDRLKKKHGLPSSGSSMSDKVILGLLKLRGMLTLLGLYRSDRTKLAFPAKFDSVGIALLRQLVQRNQG